MIARRFVVLRPRPGGTLVEIHDLVLAENDDVAVVQVMAADALRLHVDAVRAVQVLEHATLESRRDLAVVPADELALDLHVVVDRAADDQAPDAQRPFLDVLAAVRDDDAREHLVARHRARRGRGICDSRAHAVRARGVLDPLQLVDRRLELDRADGRLLR